MGALKAFSPVVPPSKKCPRAVGIPPGPPPLARLLLPCQGALTTLTTPRSVSFNLAKLGRQMRLGAVEGGAYLSGELPWRRGTHRRLGLPDAKSARSPPAVSTDLWAGTASECGPKRKNREARADAIFGRRIYADLPCQISDAARVEIVRGFAGDAAWVARRRRGSGRSIDRHERANGPQLAHGTCNLLRGQFPTKVSGPRPRSANGTRAARSVKPCSGGVPNGKAAATLSLAEAGSEDRVTLASFATRGIDAVPQRHRGHEGHRPSTAPKRKKMQNEPDLPDADAENEVLLQELELVAQRVQSLSHQVVDLNRQLARDRDGASVRSPADRPAHLEEPGFEAGELRNQHIRGGRDRSRE